MLDKVAILGFPRSGSKLLANALEQNGYFNLGEFFETYSTELIFKNGINSAVRLSVEKQKELFRTFDMNINEELHVHSMLIQDRIDQYNNIRNNIPTTLTVFTHNIEAFPELLTILNDRYFFCIQRKNVFEQILSRIVTNQHKNYNEETISEKVWTNVSLFDRYFFQIKKTERIHNFLVSRGQGRIVDFDELVAGTADIGFRYSVTTNDQHKNLESLIINISEIKERFEYLESEYLT